MSTFNNKNKDELKAIAIEKGFKEEELKELTKAELIEVIEATEHGNTANADDHTEETMSITPMKMGTRLDNLDGFKGNAVHVHETTGTGKGEHTYVRTYSEEQHGEDFLDLARSFVSKNSNRFFVK